MNSCSKLSIQARKAFSGAGIGVRTRYSYRGMKGLVDMMTTVYSAFEISWDLRPNSAKARIMRATSNSEHIAHPLPREHTIYLLELPLPRIQPNNPECAVECIDASSGGARKRAPPLPQDDIWRRTNCVSVRCFIIRG